MSTHVRSSIYPISIAWFYSIHQENPNKEEDKGAE